MKDEKITPPDSVSRQIIKSKNERITILWSRVKELESELEQKDKSISNLRAKVGTLIIIKFILLIILLL